MQKSIDQSISRAARLLRAVKANRAHLPNVETHREELAQILRRLADLRSYRRKLEAERRATTVLIHEELGRVTDLTRLIRTIIQGNLGLRSEKLTLFGIAPLGSRRRRLTRPSREVRKPAA